MLLKPASEPSDALSLLTPQLVHSADASEQIVERGVLRNAAHGVSCPDDLAGGETGAARLATRNRCRALLTKIYKILWMDPIGLPHLVSLPPTLHGWSVGN